MCIQNALQQHILDITNDGKTVADFFFATMQGRTPNAKTHHRLEAAKQLRQLGLTGSIPARPEPVEGHAQEHAQEHENPPSPIKGEGWDGGEDPPHPAHPVKSNPVIDLDIINYEVAHLIREETGDGYFIADFLARAMRGADSRGRPVSPADRMAAAKELMNRGLGRFGDARDRRISNNQEDRELIHSGLSRYIRESTDRGLDAARFLLDVASGQDDSFSMHQRIVAARELTRRGWDTNYDAITPEDIAACHERQDALEPTEYDIRLQEWREDGSAAHANPREDRPREDERQLEPGIFAHLTAAEIARCEAMSDKDRQEFIEQQRQRRATRRSAAAQPTDQPETTDEHNQDLENIDWNALLQDVSASGRTPHPTHPVRSQTRIRSP